MSEKFSTLRRVHWGLIVLCFFLPVARGCNNEIIYPYRHMFDDPSPGLGLNLGLVFLYPVLLLMLKFIFSQILSWKVLWWFCYLLVGGLSFFLWDVLANDHPPVEWYVSILVLIWGVGMMGLAKLRDESKIKDLIGFLFTSFSFWLFPIVFLLCKKLLIAGWVYVYSSSLIILTYIAEFLKNRSSLRSVKNV